MECDAHSPKATAVQYMNICHSEMGMEFGITLFLTQALNLVIDLKIDLVSYLTLLSLHFLISNGKMVDLKRNY